jgi:hypothetical protein
MRTKTALAFLLPLLLAALPARGGKAERVVMLPLQNFSGVREGPPELAEMLESCLRSRGYAPIRGEEVEKLLEENRIRQLDSLLPAMQASLLARFDASLLLSGSVYTYEGGDSAIVAFSARMTRADGTPVWAAVAGLTPDQTEGWLGIGRAKTRSSLAEKAIARLASRIPAPGQAAPPRSAAGKPLRLSSPRTFRSAALPGGGVRRVCVLPFENFTEVRQAPRVVAEMLSRRLEETGRFQIVAPAEFRAAMAEEKIRSFRDMDPGALERLGRRLSSELFVRGTIYEYREASPRWGARTPRLELEFSMLNVASGKIVWASNHARAGDDYRALLQRGAIGDIVTLADQVLGEMVRAGEKSPAKKGRVEP